MRKKICKRCGKVFETPDGHNERALCPECSKQVKRESVYRERTCVICGAKFIGYPASKYCPTCAKSAERERAKKYRRMGFSRSLGSIDHCVKCGAEYIVTSGLQKYCPNCSAEAVNEKTKARKIKYNHENRDKFDANKKEMKSEAYICVICGKPFDKKTATVTCSPECAKELKRRRQAESDLKRGKRKTPLAQVKKSDNPQSGIVGITWHKGKWQVVYKKHYIGIYKTVEEAKEALEEYKNKTGT